MLNQRILFLDGEAVVIDKPAGLAVDTPRDGSPSVEAMLDQLTFGFQRLPQPVHRIDRDTSGCLLLARNPKAMKRFGQAFEAGEVTKRYIAILDGVPEGEAGIVDLPLAKVSSAATGWRMRGDPRHGKPARTRWRLLQMGEGQAKGRALVAFYPETGRTHQLRVHAAEGLGIPIMGDPVYGAGALPLGMMLHASALSVPRPGKRDITADAPWPRRFEEAGFANG
ncbi:RluA family pseudouridine synthase [Sphingomonas sp.]|uniref:RluA family pseudouridine synthase n=1 Tax=Sphingomonas sp. TaxID=28214 RepID=UPI001B2B2907|nr:RNA pseudouridine synthase [Sphingomonas sp.]MBO9714619.1 RNA pseudouridine synthase [Sphingomonas sp.]